MTWQRKQSIVWGMLPGSSFGILVENNLYAAHPSLTGAGLLLLVVGALFDETRSFYL
jgi:hypothetical protein